MVIDNIALGCIAACIGVLIVVIAYLHSCHTQQVAWLQNKLRALVEENAKLEEEVKREVSLP